MMLKLLKSAHSVGEANMHLQFTPKYRKPIFEDEDIRMTCEQVFVGIAESMGISLAGVGFGPDHAHLFVTGCKNYSAAELAQRFKGASSRVIRKNCWGKLSKWLYGDSMWSDGYFYRTVGAVSNESMRRYVVESQKKHWTAQKAATTQTTLLHFN